MKLEGQIFSSEVTRDGSGSWEDLTDSPTPEGLEPTLRNRFLTLKRIVQEQGLTLNQNSRVVEIGSGKAKFLDYLRQRGIEAIGVDARPRGSSKSPQVAGRFEQLPFSNNTFDVIFSNEVFDINYYDQDQPAMLVQIQNILKPGGVYVGREAISDELITQFNLHVDSQDPKYKFYKKS